MSSPKTSGVSVLPHTWSGTPQLFAHTAELAKQLTSVHSEPGSLRITFSCDDDIETFASGIDFLAGASPELLRRFSAMRVEATGPQGSITWVAWWVRPWWKLGWGSDSRSDLSITGSTTEWEAETRVRFLAALRRGTLGVLSPDHGVFIGSVVGQFAGAATGALLALFFHLLDVSWAVLVGWVVGIFVGAYFGAWLIPSLEVSTSRQTNFRQFLRGMATVVSGIAIAGVGHYLFERGR